MKLPKNKAILKKLEKLYLLSHNRYLQGNKESFNRIADKIITLEQELIALDKQKPKIKSNSAMAYNQYHVIYFDTILNCKYLVGYKTRTNKKSLAIQLYKCKNCRIETNNNKKKCPNCNKIDYNYIGEMIQIKHDISYSRRDISEKHGQHITTGIPTKGTYVKDSNIVNLLELKDKELLSNSGNLEQSEYIDTNNYFNIKQKQEKKKKPIYSPTYKIIVRRKKDGTMSKKRYKIDNLQYKTIIAGLDNQQFKSKIIHNPKNRCYYHVNSPIDAYFHTISLPDMYNEKIKTTVICMVCHCTNRRKNTIKDVRLNNSCSLCGEKQLKLINYRIRYFYITVNRRYKINELTGIVEKQIETMNGFSTIYKGKIAY